MNWADDEAVRTAIPGASRDSNRHQYEIRVIDAASFDTIRRSEPRRLNRKPELQRLTANLTLIAYLIGGWIAPAIHHHHGGGGTSAVSTCQVDCFHGSSQHPSDESQVFQSSASVASCQHSHGPGDATGDTEAGDTEAGDTEAGDRPSSGPDAIRNGGAVGCSGLCALCIARTLSCQRGRAARIAFEFVPVGKLNAIEALFVPQRARGQATSRGPPLFV